MTKWDKPVLQVKLYVINMKSIFKKYILSGDSSWYLVTIIALWKLFSEFSSLKKLHLWFNKLMDVLFKGAGETDCYQRKLKLDFFYQFLLFLLYTLWSNCRTWKCLYLKLSCILMRPVTFPLLDWLSYLYPPFVYMQSQISICLFIFLFYC